MDSLKEKSVENASSTFEGLSAKNDRKKKSLSKKERKKAAQI